MLILTIHHINQNLVHTDYTKEIKLNQKTLIKLLTHLQQQKEGIKRLFVVDPIIGGTKENGKKVLRMCNEQIPDTKLIAYLRPEMLDDEYVDILSKCNLEEMRFGIQTLNPQVPRMGKK